MSISSALGSYTMAALYAYGIVLIEHNKVEMLSIIMWAKGWHFSFYLTVFCSRIFALVSFSLQSIEYIMGMWVTFIVSLLTSAFMYRVKDMTASISAARNFFDLFDRKPTIDNGSNEGHELVSENRIEPKNKLHLFFLLNTISRLIFVARSLSIKSLLLIHLDLNREFSTNFNCPSRLVSEKREMFFLFFFKI
jgi:hypothetical protein